MRTAKEHWNYELSRHAKAVVLRDIGYPWGFCNWRWENLPRHLKMLLKESFDERRNRPDLSALRGRRAARL